MLLGILTGLLAALLGWQINLVSIHRGLARGKAAAFFVGLGAAFADIIFILIAFFGSVPIFRHPEWWRVIKWVGIAAIISVALKILFHRISSHAGEPDKKWGHTKNIFLGFFLVIANPAVFLLWVGVISVLLMHFPEINQHKIFYFLFPLGFVAGACSWFLFLSSWIMPRMRKWGDRSLHLISKISAVALLIAAVLLIFEKI